MKKLIVSFSAVIVSLIPIATYADDVTDLYFQQVIERYFEYPQNARTFGMAGSSVQTSINSSSVFGNPAGLGFMGGGEVSGSYSFNRISGEEFPTRENVEQRANMGASMLALPLGPQPDDLPRYGNIGAGWNYMWADWDDDTFDTEAERSQVTGAYAIALSDRLSVGYSLGWTDDRFQSNAIFNYPMAEGFRHTLGTLWQVNKDTLFGSSVMIGHGEHHALFGPGIRGDSDTFQVGVDLGVETKVNNTILAAGIDYRHLSTDGDVVSSIPPNVVGGDENGNIFNVRVGLEQEINDWSVLRLGYRYAGLVGYEYNRVELNDLNGSAKYNAWTAGVGFIIPIDYDYIDSIKLDYAAEYRAVGDNDWQHLATLSVPFNLCG